MGDQTEEVTFTIKATMRRRWAEQLLGMLDHMERNGAIGSSESLEFYSDGDGDYQPKFEVTGADDIVRAPYNGKRGGRNPVWDAG